MAESVFERSLNNRKKEQEAIKAANGLESEKITEQMHFTIPADLKRKFIKYCEENYITPSAQLRIWIAQNCNDQQLV